jgi:hypothetical protein
MNPVRRVAIMKWGIQRSAAITKLSKLPGCENFVDRQYDRYLRFKFEMDWRLRRNPVSRRSFARTPPQLNALQQRLLDELNEKGVAMCRFDEMFGSSDLWTRLSRQVEEFTTSNRVQEAIRKTQREFGCMRDPNAVAHYILTYYDTATRPTIDFGGPLLDLALSSQVLDLVNSYLEMWSKLIYFDIWHTLPLDTDTRILSQRWHRDPEDRKKIRIFLYFNEVDEQAGAMEYFAGSQLGGPYQDLFPWHDPIRTPYPPEGDMERQIPPSQRLRLSGPPGTLIFCDTAGFHRGGIAKSKPRIITTAAYVTPASLHHRRYDLGASLRTQPMSAPTRFALA